LKRHRVDYAARAEAQVVAVSLWWAENRRDSPTLFTEELAAVFERLETSPLSGAPFPASRPKDVRRVLLGRSRYHVYYTVDEDAGRVIVRAVWHVARGRGPRLA
jgi:plasmid stabilization system protein ParE